MSIRSDNSTAPNRLSSRLSKVGEGKLKFVVAIGASAGGLNSIEKLIREIPRGTGAAFVLIQHLSPDIASSMAEILSRSTQMQIETVKDGMTLEPDCIYLIPPGDEIRLVDDRFQTNLLDRNVVTRVIDTFFESLARSYQDRAIGVVLSGSGTDGAKGVQAIKKAGGICLVETFETAQFDSMPKSCAATGHVEHILPPEQIAIWLNKQFDEPSARPGNDSLLPRDELTGIDLIFSLLSRRHDVDFTYYKASTVARRIERRQKISGQNSLLDYANFANENPEELDLLYQDLLIGVTKFFRDSDAFDLIERCIDELIQKLPPGETMRVWSAGCASGEEAYSLAMMIQDAYERQGRTPEYKVFATDIHKGVLDNASSGIFDSEAMEFVSEERKRRYFDVESDTQFRVNSKLRRHLVFARHNVFRDPPFTRMYLVTCRNLLIYLKQAAQMHAISSFHFALNVDGLLFLGASESLGALSEEFKLVDSNWKVFQKIRNLPSLLGNNLSDGEIAIREGPRRLVNILNSDRPESLSFTKLLECYDLVLKQYVPSGLILDEQKNILHVFGEAYRYLISKTGRFSGSLSDFLSGDAKVTITAALIRSNKSPGKKIVLQDVCLETNSGSVLIDVEVQAMVGARVSSWVWFVQFIARPEDRPQTIEAEKEIIQHGGNDFAELESELVYTKDSLNATIEELEASNEELQAANEELVASNEELQSTNEELQSVNEELYTVNLENNRKIDELQEITDDLEVLLSTSEVGTLFLDTELNIRKFTRSMTRHFDLMQHDIGRPINNFANRLNVNWLNEKFIKTLETGEAFEAEVFDDFGDPVLLKIVTHISNGKTTGIILNVIKLSPKS